MPMPATTGWRCPSKADATATSQLRVQYSVHNRRRHGRSSLKCIAFGPDPYAPLERAIQVVNQVLTLGERSRRSKNNNGGSSGGGDGSGSSRPERWVQFGAVSSSHVAVQERLSAFAATAAARAQPPAAAEQSGSAPADGDAASSSDQQLATAAMLREYLSLPVDQYALLDPQWISRDPAGSSDQGSGGTFQLSVPLLDVVGVDLQPQLTVTAHPDPSRGRVTLVGSGAGLGSPDIDDSFRLNLVAELSRRQRRRLPKILRPDHLPGRPVMRLRRWVARARGSGENTVTITTSSSTASNPSNLTTTTTDALEASLLDGTPLPPADPCTSAEALGVDEDNEEYAQLGSRAAEMLGEAYSAESTAAVSAPLGIDAGMVALDATRSAPFPSEKIYISRDDDGEDSELEDDAVQAQQVQEEVLAPSSIHLSAAAAGGSSSFLPQPQAGAASGEAAPQLLHCRVNVTMAIRVPGPLTVVPNALLGYAGSLILRAVLNATLPNFLDLLCADFQRWAEGGGQRQQEAATGELFGPVSPQQDAAQG